MVIQLELEPELLERAKADAEAEGMTVEAYLHRLLHRALDHNGHHEWTRGDLYAERVNRIEGDIERALRDWEARTQTPS